MQVREYIVRGLRRGVPTCVFACSNQGSTNQ